MSLPSGTRLGPYAIVSPIGAGGMGEVYRARDTKLNRDVAIKVLPESFALDAETKRSDEGIRVNKIEALPYQAKGGAGYVQLHAQNFVAAIKKGDPSILKCGIETGAVAAINAAMGNVAFKLGRKVLWDAEKGEFKNDGEANRLAKATYHNGWKLPG